MQNKKGAPPLHGFFFMDLIVALHFKLSKVFSGALHLRVTPACSGASLIFPFICLF